jgi:hypothetical protein
MIRQFLMIHQLFESVSALSKHQLRSGSADDRRGCALIIRRGQTSVTIWSAEASV